MRTADGGAARTHADKRRVASAAVNPCSGTEAQFLRGLFRQKPRHVGAFNDLRQVPRLDAVHPAKFFVPALTTGPRVIKKRRIGRITRHDEFSRRPCDQGFLHIQPLVGLLEDFRLMRLYPFIFPERILDTRGRSVRRAQRAQQHPDVHAGNTRPVRLTCLEFRQSPLVHIAHRRRSARPFSSTSTMPCICEQKEMPDTCAGITSVFSNTARVVQHMAAHHSSASCSAPPSGRIYSP